MLKSILTGFVLLFSPLPVEPDAELIRRALDSYGR